MTFHPCTAAMRAVAIGSGLQGAGFVRAVDAGAQPRPQRQFERHGERHDPIRGCRQICANTDLLPEPCRVASHT